METQTTITLQASTWASLSSPSMESTSGPFELDFNARGVDVIAMATGFNSPDRFSTHSLMQADPILCYVRNIKDISQ